MFVKGVVNVTFNVDMPVKPVTVILLATVFRSEIDYIGIGKQRV